MELIIHGRVVLTRSLNRRSSYIGLAEYPVAQRRPGIRLVEYMMATVTYTSNSFRGETQIATKPVVHQRVNVWWHDIGTY